MIVVAMHNRAEDGDLVLNLKSPILEKRRKAENQFFARYQYFVREAARKYNVTEDSLYDVYSDSIIGALESIRSNRFQERSSLKTFLYQIFKFKCVDYFRKLRTRRNVVHQTVSLEGLQLHLFDASGTILEQLIQKSEKQFLKAHFTKLCNRSQRLLMLSAEGFTDDEIATQLEFKTGKVVKTSRLRCIRKLRLLNEHQMRGIA